MITNIKIIDVLTNLNVATSKREAREFLKSNTISINNVIVNDENILLKDIESKFDKYYLIKRGKRKQAARAACITEQLQSNKQTGQDSGKRCKM